MIEMKKLYQNRVCISIILFLFSIESDIITSNSKFGILKKDNSYEDFTN